MTEMILQDRIVVDQLYQHSNCTSLHTEYKKAIGEINYQKLCPAEFDGVSCWPPSFPGTNATRPCPASFKQVSVSRFCKADGAWEPLNNGTYNPCGLLQDHVAALRRVYGYLRAPGAKVPAKWYLHQRHAECLDKINEAQPPAIAQKDGINVCPMTFDGWSCWDFTLPGDTAFASCPKYMTGFDPTRFAFRKCTENGTWFKHPETGNSWSNYTTCVDVEDLQFRQLVNTLYISGYSLSFVALVLSLLLFTCFKALKCTRIAIHVQLFASFALNNLMWIIWYYFVVGDLDTVEKNNTWCQVLHVILQYLMVSNYAWMFCEGMHLHLALVVVFVKDDVVMRWFYAVGWILPALLASVYALVRSYVVQETERCWMEDSHSTWLLTAPVLLSMLANLFFLINVVRVLLTKLHPRSSNPAPRGMRKAVRATLILMPLFGIHHILIPFRPEPRAPGESLYQIFSAFVVSLQGFCVACLFCFANVDVHGAIRAWVRHLRRLRANPYAPSTGPTNTATREACVGL
ncbi:calcitonin gene-related peptide type 1 receptor-like isoform X2 [Neocloeon triangulifer]|uniref:calcitonin gene-related peptide type 1 receptor-like isoform X2 n=1 Tax=Neocloeon triangulifer TaxID=2078957 RepID=UPI00286F3ABD|nr:calcitonin gene-related peptide type 1 receptor-like isoform X2 [Neocloeon triangulifer]